MTRIQHSELRQLTQRGELRHIIVRHVQVLQPRQVLELHELAHAAGA